MRGTWGWRWWWGLKAVLILCSFSQLETLSLATAQEKLPSPAGFHACALKMPLTGIPKVLLSEVRSQVSGWATQGDAGRISKRSLDQAWKGHGAFDSGWAGRGMEINGRIWQSGNLISSCVFVMTNQVHLFPLFICSFIQQLLIFTLSQDCASSEKTEPNMPSSLLQGVHHLSGTFSFLGLSPCLYDYMCVGGLKAHLG